jgi:ubiquinone/menaquinone biosynthesis C-methylase UbiE
MQTINNDSIITGIQRLGLKESDTYCEIGAGDGLGIKSIIEPDASSLIDEMVYVRVPARIILVEISDDFRRQLLRVVNHDIPEKFRSRIEVHGHDCKHMHFLSDNSVDTIFAMNVVYFLNPLSDYLEEIHRVLKPGGFVVFGCKFMLTPKDSSVFVNVDEDIVKEAMQKAGFLFSKEDVIVSNEEPIKNFVELKGIKKK